MVTDDPDQADTAAARGERVVLIVPPGEAGHRARAGLALFVGDPTDPGVRAAAAAMDAELGGAPARP